MPSGNQVGTDLGTERGDLIAELVDVAGAQAHLQIRLRARDIDELCDQIAAFGSEIGPHLVAGGQA